MTPKRAIQIEQLHKLMEDVERVSKRQGSPSPGEFLATVMSGQDPRPMDSPLYELVRKIALREFTGGDPHPSEEEWTTIQTMVLDSDLYKASRVPIEQSLTAAQKLMEYLHAKMKAVEVSGGLDVKVEVKPLTGDELDAFKERFDDEF